MTDEDQAIIPSWEDVANRWERAYNKVCGERDALVAEVRRDEPDRPRRDVSIEEAERMPMTDEELDAIERAVQQDPYYDDKLAIRDGVLALVAEVRRLRAVPAAIEREIERELAEAEEAEWTGNESPADSNYGAVHALRRVLDGRQ